MATKTKKPTLIHHHPDGTVSTRQTFRNYKAVVEVHFLPGYELEAAIENFDRIVGYRNEIANEVKALESILASLEEGKEVISTPSRKGARPNWATGLWAYFPDYERFIPQGVNLRPENTGTYIPLEQQTPISIKEGVIRALSENKPRLESREEDVKHYGESVDEARKNQAKDLGSYRVGSWHSTLALASREANKARELWNSATVTITPVNINI